MTDASGAGKWMIYGATGYSGRMILETAMKAGHRPVLGGRQSPGLWDLAKKHGLECRMFTPGDDQACRQGMSGISLVLNCAGPFSQTAAGIMGGARQTGAHYLDITGEIDVFEAAYRLDRETRAAGLMAVPGVGFDVVPTDCLAHHLKAALPEADSLHLALAPKGGGLSPGTMKTALEALPGGGRIRSAGALTSDPLYSRMFVIPGRPPTGDAATARGRVRLEAYSFPWGDVASAYRTTGIRTIVTYLTVPRQMVRMAPAARVIGPLLRLPGAIRLGQRLIKAFATGPDQNQRASGGVWIYGEARVDGGKTVGMGMMTAEGYTFTADAAMAAVSRVLGGDVRPGVLTPTQAFGPEFALAIPGTRLVPAAGATPTP